MVDNADGFLDGLPAGPLKKRFGTVFKEAEEVHLKRQLLRFELQLKKNKRRLRELEQQKDSDEERDDRHVQVVEDESDSESESESEEEKDVHHDVPDKQDGGISGRLSTSLNISGQKPQSKIQTKFGQSRFKMPTDVNASGLMKCALGKNSSAAQGNSNNSNNNTSHLFGVNTTQSSIPRDANTSLLTQNPQSSDPFNLNHANNNNNNAHKNQNVDEKMNNSELD